MAIVPPGNKQIGDYTNIVVTNLRVPIVKEYIQSGFTVSKDPSITGNIEAPKNKFIGDYTQVVVTYKPCPTVMNYLITGLVVTKYLPPSGFFNLFTGGFVTTKDTAITTPAMVPVKNKFIGDYTAIVVTKKPVPETRNLLTVGFVVTREFTPRVETLIMNLKYNTPGELTFT